MITRNFIAIGPTGNPDHIAGVIVNDHEKQLDCDYYAEFEEDGEGETPARYEVVVTVKELGPL